MKFEEYLAGASDVLRGQIAGLAYKLIEVGEEIEYIQKDAVNKAQGYNYASEKAIKEAFYPALRKRKILFWVESRGEVVRHVTQNRYDREAPGVITGEQGTLVVPGSFHFLDAETGAHIYGDLAGSGRGGDDKGVYIANTGIIKYALTTGGGVVTGDDAEADHPVEGSGGGSRPSSPSLPGVDDSTLLVCLDCGTRTTYGDVRSFKAGYDDKRGRWTEGKMVYYCPGCPKGPKGGKKVMSVALAMAEAKKGGEE